MAAAPLCKRRPPGQPARPGRDASHHDLSHRLYRLRAAPQLPRHLRGRPGAGGGAGAAGGRHRRGGADPLLLPRLLRHGLARRAAAPFARDRRPAGTPAQPADGGEHRRRLRHLRPRGVHGRGRGAGQPGRRQRGRCRRARGRPHAGLPEARARGARGHEGRPGAGSRAADGPRAARARGGPRGLRPCGHAGRRDRPRRLRLRGAGLRPLRGRPNPGSTRRHQGGDGGTARARRRGQPALPADARHARPDRPRRLRRHEAGRGLRHHRARLHP